MVTSPKTCQDLMDMIDRMAPGPTLNSIFQHLRWQSEHGRRPGHLRQYLERAYYQQYPRERQTGEAVSAVKKLAMLTRHMGDGGRHLTDA